MGERAPRQSVHELTRRHALALAASAAIAPMLAGRSAAEDDPVNDLIARTTKLRRPPRGGFAPPGPGSDQLPDLSFDYSQGNAARARGWLAEIARLRRGKRSDEENDTLDVLQWDLERDVGLTPYYWMEFPLAPYTSLLNIVRTALGRGSLASSAERESFLALLAQVPGYLDQITAKLRGQIERGFLVHREAVEGALAPLRATRSDLAAWVGVSAQRLGNSEPASAFQSDVTAAIERRVGPAFDALLSVLATEYLPKAGDTVGVGRWAGGLDYYRELYRYRISLDADPRTLHATAMEDLAAIDADLAQMRRKLGGGDDAAAFHLQIANDPRWRASDEADVARRLNEAVAKIEPHLGELFNRVPSTPYGVAPVPAELRATFVNGVFSGPNAGNPRGTYLFNPSNLDTTTWIWAAPLIYHELVPGHHFQQATVFESRTLTPYRQSFFVSGYAEGWGEYARHLANGLGVYDEWSAYADRLMDRRFALLSAMDSGMHAEGWSLQQADDFLAQDPLTKPALRRRLVLAYAVDFPAFGFAYWAGRREFLRLRREAEVYRGAAFDLRAFNDLLLSGGVLPFGVVGRRLQRAGFLPKS